MRQGWGETAPTPSALKLSLRHVLSSSTRRVAKEEEREGDPVTSRPQGVEVKS